MKRIRIGENDVIEVRHSGDTLRIVVQDIGHARKQRAVLGFSDPAGAFVFVKSEDPDYKPAGLAQILAWCEVVGAIVEFGVTTTRVKLGGREFEGTRFAEAVELAKSWWDYYQPSKRVDVNVTVGPGPGRTEVPGFPRLIRDATVDEFWPLVDGTWVSVNSVASRVACGATIESISREFPELSEADILECVRYCGIPPARHSIVVPLI